MDFGGCGTTGGGEKGVDCEIDFKDDCESVTLEKKMSRRLEMRLHLQL